MAALHGWGEAAIGERANAVSPCHCEYVAALSLQPIPCLFLTAVSG